MVHLYLIEFKEVGKLREGHSYRKAALIDRLTESV